MVTHRMCSELTIVPAFAETATLCQQLVASSLAADADDEPDDEPDLPLSPSPVAGERRVSGVRLSEPSKYAVGCIQPRRGCHIPTSFLSSLAKDAFFQE